MWASGLSPPFGGLLWAARSAVACPGCPWGGAAWHGDCALFSRWWSAPAAPAVGVRGSIPRVGPRGIACLTETPVLRGFSLALMPSPPASRLPPPLPLTRTEGLAYCCMDKSVSSVTYGRSSPPGILPHLQIRGACWPARSVGTHLHAAWRWNVSRPGDPAYAVSSHLQHNPRRWRLTLHQGDHTQLDKDGFWSEMRCRGVLLLVSRISVPSPATPCTLITPNGAPHGPISRICFVPLTGANAGACLRMVT